MKVKTFLVGVFIMMSAVMFGMKVWNSLAVIFPILENAEWMAMKIPVINAEIGNILQSAFITVLAIIGSKIKRGCLFK